MTDFENLSDIVEEICKDLGKNDSERLDQLIKSRYKQRYLANPLLNFLTNETELNRFVTAFQDAQNIQICFIIDVTSSMANHYANFKNQVFGAIMDGIVSTVNHGQKRYAYIGYRERNESHEFVQFTDNLNVVRNAIKNTKTTV